MIRGGDGSDTLSGNEDLDRLWGGVGPDLFIGDNVEFHDLEPNEWTTLSESQDSIAQVQVARSRQVAYTTQQLTSVISIAENTFNSPPTISPPTFGASKTVLINTSTMTVMGDDNSASTFFGTGATFAVVTLPNVGDVAEIVVKGDLVIGPDSITVIGTRPLSIRVLNDVFIADTDRRVPMASLDRLDMYFPSRTRTTYPAELVMVQVRVQAEVEEMVPLVESAVSAEAGLAVQFD